MLQIIFNEESSKLELNADQSNLAKGGIAVASLPNASFVFGRWQHKTGICNCMFWLGFNPQISPVPGNSWTPRNTVCRWIPHVYLPNGINPSNCLSRMPNTISIIMLFCKTQRKTRGSRKERKLVRDMYTGPDTPNFQWRTGPTGPPAMGRWAPAVNHLWAASISSN